MIDTKQCPCNSGILYSECCAAVLSGQRKAVTAEELMRSRYSAYVTGDMGYVLRTWHPSARPPAIDPDTIPNWRGLEIIRTEKGQENDDEGIVEFQATARSQHNTLTLREVSHFVQEAGQWFYVSGEIRGDSPWEERQINKVGRNCPCPCGSGKKFKKCCGR